MKKDSERLWLAIAENELKEIQLIFEHTQRIKSLLQSNEVLTNINFVAEILYNTVDDQSDEFLVAISTDGKTLTTDYIGDFEKIPLQDISIFFKINILEQLENIVTLEDVEEFVA